MPRKIAIVNSKGGVGKTTVTLNLGAYLAALGQNTLLVDADPNLAIIRKFSKNPIFGLTVITWPKFKNLKLNYNTSKASIKRFSSEARGSYNFILFDCAPGLGRLAQNALKISQEIIVPVQYVLDNLPKGKILVSMFDRRNQLDRKILKNVRRNFEHFETIIPKSVSLAESFQLGQPILKYAPFSKASRAYRDLAKEVLSAL